MGTIQGFKLTKLNGCWNGDWEGNERRRGDRGRGRGDSLGRTEEGGCEATTATTREKEAIISKRQGDGKRMGEQAWRCEKWACYSRRTGYLRLMLI